MCGARCPDLPKDFVRLQVNVSRQTIGDLRKKKFLRENEIDKDAIGQALMQAALVGIKVTEV